MIVRTLQGLLRFVLLAFVIVSSPTMADTGGGDMKTVGNVLVYLGLLPTEMIRGHPQEHPEASMHGGVPSGSGQYHVIIALFDAKTGARIENADISARVFEIGLAGVEKKLESMQIAGTISYGNFFPMVGRGPFRISLTIHVPGQAQAIKTEFEHRHNNWPSRKND